MRMNRKLFGVFCLGMGAAALPLYLVACGVFPTTNDVNMLAMADHAFVASEHETIRDQMTAEHGIQTPAAVDLLAQVNADAAVAVQQLRERVDAVVASGAELSDFGSLNDWITALAALLAGGGAASLVSGRSRPSRATTRIDELERHLRDKIATLELALATAAKAGAAVPSDGLGLPTPE